MSRIDYLLQEIRKKQQQIMHFICDTFLNYSAFNVYILMKYINSVIFSCQ